ncbi:MAG: sulfatase [bacterium]|jgi:arylsulfatase A
MLPRRDFLKNMGVFGSIVAAGGISVTGNHPVLAQAADQPEKLPNIVIIFTDDQGYADVGVFGAKGFTTPNLDRMAQEGVRFTDFYVAQPVCGASRAALLTGCYPNRIGILGAPGPNSKIGIHDNEMILAELLKQKDYATAIFGKWHLGDHPTFLPTRHGFDEYLGLPYSNDMWPRHPENPKAYPPLPLIEGENVIEENPDMDKLTTLYTERAVQFIEKNRDRPFFLYLAHSMPHVPLGVSDKFKGKSEQGMYGDVIMEIDWSVGQILDTLERNDLAENTLVIFTTDNGPWLSYGNHAGSAAPLREGKGTVWDGGTSVPCIMRFPGTIPAGTVQSEPAMTIDLFPTIAHITGAKLPDHPIDGKNIWSLITVEPEAKSPQEAYYFYWGDDLQAVRCGEWKLHFPHAYRTLNGRPGGRDGIPAKYEQAKTELALYNLRRDREEQHNVADEHPEIVEKLKTLAERKIAEIGDKNHKGSTERTPGTRPEKMDTE